MFNLFRHTQIDFIPFLLCEHMWITTTFLSFLSVPRLSLSHLVVTVRSIVKPFSTKRASTTRTCCTRLWRRNGATTCRCWPSPIITRASTIPAFGVSWPQRMHLKRIITWALLVSIWFCCCCDIFGCFFLFIHCLFVRSAPFCGSPFNSRRPATQAHLQSQRDPVVVGCARYMLHQQAPLNVLYVR